MKSLEHEENSQLSPIDLAKEQVVHDKLVEFFGPDYLELSDPVDLEYIQILNIPVTALDSLGRNNFLIRNLTPDEFEEIEEEVMRKLTPKSFRTDSGEIKSRANVMRSDIAMLVRGTFMEADARGLMGERQLTFEEE